MGTVAETSSGRLPQPSSGRRPSGPMDTLVVGRLSSVQWNIATKVSQKTPILALFLGRFRSKVPERSGRCLNVAQMSGQLTDR